MKHSLLKWVCGIIMGLSLLTAGLATFVSSLGFVEMAASQAGEIASEALEARIELGQVRILSLHSVGISGAEVYDKNNEKMASIKEAKVRFSLLSMLFKAPSECIDTVELDGADVSILQRPDGSWNYQDFVSDTPSESKFTGKIKFTDSVLRSNYQQQDIVLEKVNGALDFANDPEISFKGTCESKGAEAKVSASFGGDQDTFSLDLKNVALEDYVGLLPEGSLDSDVVSNIAGRITRLQVAGTRNGEELAYSGEGTLEAGTVTVLGTKLEDIKGLVLFNEKKIKTFINAQANGQKASAHGDIMLTGGMPVLNLSVESEGLDPSAIFQDIPYKGAIAFKAQVTGPANNPEVRGSASIAQGQVAGVAFTSAKADIFYADSMVLAENIAVDALGGHISGEARFSADTYDVFANLHLQNVDAARVTEAGSINVPVAGSVSGDVTVNGNARDVNSLRVWGTVQANGAQYKGVALGAVEASFAKLGSAIDIDYVKLQMPNGGTLGLDGKYVMGDTMDISFYGSELDMSIVKEIMPQVDVTGFLDVNGTAKGPVDNPIIRAKYAAHSGSIMQQPFDRLHGSAGGSLRGIKINDTQMEYGEKTKWYINGVMGFFGDMPINMRVDTVAARMEDLIKPVAADQPITGNVDNVITITGTLKNPHIVGYIHFYQGSYKGVFITGMDGDYTMENKTIRLQDFHVFTPWVDMDLNGTIDPQENLDMYAKVHEVNLERYNNTLPVALSGQGRFDGKLTGTISQPVFNGNLEASEFGINGQVFEQAKGDITYRDKRLYAENFVLQQKEGNYLFNGVLNLNNDVIHGKLAVEQGDIHSLVVMAGLKDNRVNGVINGSIVLNGTIDKPEAVVNAYITNGKLDSYSLDNVVLNGSFADRKIQLQELSGNGGDSGYFEVKGTADLDGAVAGAVHLRNIDVGAVTGAAGIQLPVTGQLSSDFEVSGTTAEPKADIPITVYGIGVSGAQADVLAGMLHLADNKVEIEQLEARKELNQRTYKLEAEGTVPLAAFTDDTVTEDNQFDVDISLEDAELSLLPAVTKYVDWALGETGGHVHIKGTAKRPYINGSIDIQNGAVKFKDLLNPITDMNVRLMFIDNTMTVEQLQGKMGSGDFNGAGFVHLDGLKPDNYNFDLNLNELGIDCSFFRGPLTASVNVQSMIREDRHTGETQIIPKLSGRLFLENDIISLPTLPESSGDMPLIALDYSVELGKHVKFISSQLGNLDLAGSAYFGGDTLMPRTSGSIYVRRGYISYLKTSFRVMEGAAQFGLPETLFPKMVLRAGTQINKTKVFLALDGPINQMKFRLMSTPKMSEAEIIQLLTLRSDYFNQKDDGSKITSMLNIGLQMTILGEVEAAMRNVLNLDMFSIERDTVENNNEKIGDKTSHEVYNVKMGKNITDKLMLRFNKSVSEDDYKYGFTYELSDKINLTYMRDQDNDTITGVEARFSF